MPVGSTKPPAAPRPSTSSTSSTNRGLGAPSAFLLMATLCTEGTQANIGHVADLLRPNAGGRRRGQRIDLRVPRSITSQVAKMNTTANAPRITQ